ncbi:hypothetical protein OESDEN_19846, partial [Oesophagostomum dentatum]
FRFSVFFLFSDDHHDPYVRIELKKISITGNETHYIKRVTSLFLAGSVDQQPNIVPNYRDSSGTCYYGDDQKTRWKEPCLDIPEFDWFMSSGTSDCSGANSSHRKRNAANSYAFCSTVAIFGLLLSL